VGYQNGEAATEALERRKTMTIVECLAGRLHNTKMGSADDDDDDVLDY